MWGSIYYVFEPVDIVSEFLGRASRDGASFAKRGAEDYVKTGLKESSKFLQRGRNLLSMGGVALTISVNVDGHVQKDTYVPQKILSDESWNKMKNYLEDTKKSASELLTDTSNSTTSALGEFNKIIQKGVSMQRIPRRY